eukprot:4098539-Pleurochrysis_carterae.AAC.1
MYSYKRQRNIYTGGQKQQEAANQTKLTKSRLAKRFDGNASPVTSSFCTGGKASDPKTIRSKAK